MDTIFWLAFISLAFLSGVFYVLFPERVLRWTWIDRKFLALVGLEKWMPAFFFSPLWVRLFGLWMMVIGLIAIRILLLEL